MLVQTVLLQETVERAPTDSQPTGRLFLVPSGGFIGSKDLLSLKRSEGSGKYAPFLGDLARSLSNLEWQIVERQDCMCGGRDGSLDDMLQLPHVTRPDGAL